MSSRAPQLTLIFFVFLLLFLSGSAIAVAQLLTPNPHENPTAASMAARGHIDLFSEFNLWRIGDEGNSPLEGPSGSISRLDLKAPPKARNEYSKGYVLLMQKDLGGAAEHLQAAISTYPAFVAAHNALGTAYLKLGQNEEARAQFAQAVSLDDHLPASYLNLGCAQLALKDYPDAELSVRKASSIAPLDLQLVTALAYVELMNRDYTAVIATAQKVHGRKHKGAALVHFYAAAAWQNQNNLTEAQSELETFLHEDPKSPQASSAQQVMDQMKAYQAEVAKQKEHPPAVATVSSVQIGTVRVGPTPEQQAERTQLARQASKEEAQIAEAEAAKPDCATCGAETSTARVTAPTAGSAHVGSENAPSAGSNPFSLHRVVDEVAVLFAATDHGKPVTDLTRRDVAVLDNREPPVAITGFRNEAELPLRLGIIIDTSESVAGRFSFEQRTAARFLQDVLTNGSDLAFVVGVANSVLVAQDFTHDQRQLAHGIDQLAPGGGTALWDAVSFAAQKLAGHPETQPVARLLVVISDGQDNSSQTTLKEAIESAETGDVFVYTVSSTGINPEDQPAMGAPLLVGGRALRLLAERTGGAAFEPKTFGGLDRSLEEVQRVIRSRYLISYKPALFRSDGQYRAINISAQQSGHKLRVYARKGYYTRTGGGNGDY
jgi:Ca-activated chloride channel family protein